MPGKVNPVMAEVVNQVAFQVIGNDNTICLASEAGQFELNVMEPVLVFNLLQSISIMNNVFKVFRTFLVEGVTANAERMKAYVDGSVGVITALNPHVGYETAARIAREANLTGKPVRELILRDRGSSEGAARRDPRSVRDDQAGHRRGGSRSTRKCGLRTRTRRRDAESGSSVGRSTSPMTSRSSTTPRGFSAA